MLDHQNLFAVQEAAQAAVVASRRAGVRVCAVEPWGGGAHNSGFKLLLDDGARLFMKIEKENIFPRTRRCQIEREVFGIRLAAQAGLDVPEIVGYDFTGCTAGCRYLLEEFIDGELLGSALEPLSEEQRAPLLADFQCKMDALYAVHGEVFGELYPGGWLGQYESWREMLNAFSMLLLEDAATLADYREQELAVIRNAHAAALEAVRYEGRAILTHNDLHEYNVFVEAEEGTPPGRRRVGKLFDFGLSLFQAEYVSCFGQFGFNGMEAQVARRFNVSEGELRGFALISGLEFVNFAGAIRFAPDMPYGCATRSKEYLALCEAFL